MIQARSTIPHNSFWRVLWHQFKKHRLGFFALMVVFLFVLVGIYAPFLASSKPLIVMYDGQIFFPLFRYLFYQQFFTKRLDIFFNLMIFTFPIGLGILYLVKKSKMQWLVGLCLLQLLLFIYICYHPVDDPAGDPRLSKEHNEALKQQANPSWDFDLKYLNDYAKLNLVLAYMQQKSQHQRLSTYLNKEPQNTLYYLTKKNNDEKIEREKQSLEKLKGKINSEDQIKRIKAEIDYIFERQKWLNEESKKIEFDFMPLLSNFHWEDDAGGSQSLNRQLPWWELTRVDRKDLLSALIFGVRISLIVGFLAVAIAVAIAIPIGAIAGFYGGTIDILVSRLLEVWEAMPTFFMLLMAVAIIQNKSIFIVIAIIGLFGWTGFSRFLRGEFFKQRSLPYVEACYAMGFSNLYTMFVHILPNAIPPILTLLPFAIMGAISSEAGLSFLGLGEEGSCSWGVLMDEGRSAFPGEGRLLWPPAILLTILLVAIALVGDALRDTFDPKMHKI